MHAAVIMRARVGTILLDDPWRGTTTDWTVPDTDGWEDVKTVPDVPTGVVSALQVERAQTAGSNTASMRSVPVKVTPFGPNMWHYSFHYMFHLLIDPSFH